MGRLTRAGTGHPRTLAVAAGVAMAISAVVTVGTVSFGSPADRGVLAWWAVALCLEIPLLLLSIVVHELGHLGASRLAGFRVERWRVWPVEVERVPDGWGVRARWGAFVSGGIATIPLTVANLRARHVFMITAGPAAQLAMGLAMASTALVRADPHVELGAVFVVAAALANLAPVRVGPTRQVWTDGRWLRCWARDPERAAQRLAGSALQLAAHRGDRPRRWDEALVRLAATVGRRPRNPEQVVGSQLASLWALDRGDPALAASYSDRALAGIRFVTPSSRAVLAAQRAFLAARYLGRVEAAERLLASETVRAASTAIDVGLAEAAVHLASGRPAEAVETADRTLDGTPGFRASRSGIAVLAREQVEEVRELALGALTSAAVRAP